MADDEFKPDFEQIYILNSAPSPSSSIFSQPQKNSHLKDWSMVVIRDSLTHQNPCIFPPANHENLHLSSHNDRKEQNPVSLELYPSSSSSWPSSSSSSSSSSSLTSFPPSDDDSSGPPSPLPSGSQVKKSVEVTGLMGVGFGFLRSKIFSVSSRFGFKAGWAFWSFVPAAKIAVVMVLWLMYMRRRRTRFERESVDQLRLVIKEKDEKISQLLQQIAQLNEVLLARTKVLDSK